MQQTDQRTVPWTWGEIQPESTSRWMGTRRHLPVDKYMIIGTCQNRMCMSERHRERHRKTGQKRERERQREPKRKRKRERKKVREREKITHSNKQYLSVSLHTYNYTTISEYEQIILQYQNIIIIIIIIAFKGAIRDFLQSPHSAANCLQHVRSSGPGTIACKSRATHRALITCKCHVTCHLVRRDSSAIKFDRTEIAFISALFYWLNH